MEKIYVLTFVDLMNVGYNVSYVKLFKDKKDAWEYMADEYDKRCELEGISRDSAYSGESLDYGIDDNYAYIFGSFYWDIFAVDSEN